MRRTSAYVLVAILSFLAGSMIGAIVTGNPWFALIIFGPCVIGLAVVRAYGKRHEDT